MMLTQEKANTLSDYLAADQERALKLLSMDADEAMTAINSDGYNFTLDELNEYCAALKTAVSKVNDGELSEDELADVAGGVIVVTTGLVLGLAGCFAGGVVVGGAIGARW